MELRTVLLVDDDAGICRVAEISLGRIGKWKVVVANSGAEALSILSDFIPDIILLDVMMPGMNGPSTLSQIQKDKRLADTPVIFMTAKVQNHEVQLYYDCGAAGVISKPFDPVALPVEVKRIFEKATERTCVA